MLLQLLVISMVIFAVMFATPGSPEQVLLGTTPSTPEALQAIREKFNFDKPLITQYGLWLRDALTFDFGRSVQTGQSALTEIGERLPITLLLAGYALFIVVLVAVPAGLVAGSRADSAIDRLVTAVITIGVSAPVFAVGTSLLYVFGVLLGWFPVYGSGTGLLDRVWHLTLPALTLSLTVIALVSRQTRAASIRVNAQDYMTFARARGLPRSLIWRRYLLRNSSLPIASSVGVVLASFLGGAVVVEQTFAIQGIGSLVLTSISTKDIPVVQAVGLLVASFVLMSNFAADVAYMLIDPRHRKKVLK
jgi:peptide/nickel transport system permease protein